MILLCAPASATDLAPKRLASPLLPASDSWTGFYVGLGGGKSALNNRISALPGTDPSSPGISASLNGLGADGWFATVSAGYDYQFAPSFVVGVFGDYDFHNLKSALNVDIAAIPLTAHGEISVDRQWSIGARMGYLATPGTLVFLSGGYTELGLSNFSASASGPFPTMTFAATVPKIAGRRHQPQRFCRSPHFTDVADRQGIGELQVLIPDGQGSESGRPIDWPSVIWPIRSGSRYRPGFGTRSKTSSVNRPWQLMPYRY